MPRESFFGCGEELRRYVGEIEFEEVINEGVWDSHYTHSNRKKYFWSRYIRNCKCAAIQTSPRERSN